jgi:hypothetical protein
VEASNRIESVILVVNQFLQALDSRSWHQFEACFASSATVCLTDTPSDEEGLLPWQSIRQGWRQVFNAEFRQIGPLAPGRHRPLVEVRGGTAFVSFGSGLNQQRAMILGLLDGHWLIRHLNVERLPLRGVESKAAEATAQGRDSAAPEIPAWFTPVLVFTLIAMAPLSLATDSRSFIQVSAAVLAVFFGAAMVLRGQVGAWIRDNVDGTLVRDMPLTGSGALGVMIGAAFLIT